MRKADVMRKLLFFLLTSVALQTFGQLEKFG